MKELYFYDNRDIIEDNVKKCYAMISKYGFQPSISKIKYVEGDDLKNAKLYRISIVPKRNDKPLSINNFLVKKEEVTDEKERETAQAPADGQHSLIAIYILEKEGEFTFDEKTMTEVVKVPEGMSLKLFTGLINNGKSWTYNDFRGMETGNTEIDYIESQIVQCELKADVVYSFYTLGQTDLKPAMVRNLKVGLDKLPKTLELNEGTRSIGDKILKAFEDSKLSKVEYNNGRLAKGLKLFYKEKQPSIKDVLAIIEAMNKDVWHEGYHKPTGSPEAKNYAENFAQYYEDL